MSRLLSALLLGFLTTSSLWAETWPTFRGPNSTGQAQGQNLPEDLGKHQLWKVALPGLANSSPVIWDDRLFLLTSAADGKDRQLLCLDSRTGEKKWSKTFPGNKAHTHKLNTMASSTPATDGQAVYAAIWDGEGITFYAHDMLGKELWKKSLGTWKSQHGPGSSPVFFQDKVILTYDMDGKSTLFAFNKKTGATAWESSREAYRACYSPPIFLKNQGNQPEMLVTSTTALQSYNPVDGDVFWSWHWDFSKSKMPLRTINAPLQIGDLLFACSGDGGGDRYMVALQVKGTGKDSKVQLLWDNRKDFPYVPGLLSQGDHLYFINDYGYIACFEARTGKKVWMERADSCQVTSSPILVDGKIIAATEPGDVYVFPAQPKYQEPYRFTVGGRISASPAVADGRLYIRTNTHLVCYGNKK